MVGSAEAPAANVKNCYFVGALVGGSQVGGIVGYKAKVENCYADVDINKGLSQGVEIGGILGGNSPLGIKNCYSKGTIGGTDTRRSGIASSIGKHADNLIVNCYSLVNVGNGQAISYNHRDNALFNTFYLIGTANYASNATKEWRGVTAKDKTYMKSQAFVDELNNGEDNWTRNNNINEGYPILKNIKYRK